MKTSRRYQIVLFFVLLVLSFKISAQPPKNWDQEKIMGRRYVLHERYKGSPYLNKDWVLGQITFNSGEKRNQMPIKYDGFHDELITYSKLNSSLIQIEKSTIKSFKFTMQGNEYYFERRFFTNFLKDEDRFFQVFYDGNVDLLCYRKIELTTTSLYWDASGNMKHKEFRKYYKYFLFKEGKGYRLTNLRKESLLRYFSGTQKKQVKQLIRKNHIHFDTPEEFARALSVLEENGIQINL